MATINFARENNEKEFKVASVEAANRIRLETEDGELSPQISIPGVFSPEDTSRFTSLEHPALQQSISKAKELLEGKTVTIQFLPSVGDIDKSNQRYQAGMIYLNEEGTLVPYPKRIIESGFAYYDNRLELELRQDQGLTEEDADLDISFVDAEIRARKGKIGVWAKETSADAAHKAVLRTLKKPEFIRNIVEAAESVRQEKRERTAVASGQENRVPPVRKYSNSLVGKKLEDLSRKLFPSKDSLTLVSRIAAGNLDRDALMIGPLWAGLPTAEREAANLGPVSHPSHIRQVRKDGDIQKIFTSGMLRTAMGDKPPFEGIQIDIIIEPEGIETFLVPLVGLLRSNPIVQCRNIHLSRFVRPIFSNQEYYSRNFGDIGILLEEETDDITDRKEKRERRQQQIDLMHMLSPVHLAVEAIELDSIENSDGSYLLSLYTHPTETENTIGDIPKYVESIRDAFELQKRRLELTNKEDAESILKSIAAQLDMTDVYEAASQEREQEAAAAVVLRDIAKSDDFIDSFVVKNRRLIYVKDLLTTRDIESQIKKNREGKLSIEKLFYYRPCFGPNQNKTLLERVFRFTSGGGNNFPEGEDRDQLYSYIKNIGFPLPSIAGSIMPRSNRVNPGLFDEEYSTRGSNTDSAKNVRSEVERNFRTLISENESTYGVAGSGNVGTSLRTMFLVSGRNDLKAYPVTYKNFKKDGIWGIGDEDPILEPFELVMTTSLISPEGGSAITNLDVEFVCADGLPMVTASGSEGEYDLLAREANALRIDGNFDSFATRTSLIREPDADNTSENSGAYRIVRNLPNPSEAIGNFYPEITSSTMYLPKIGTRSRGNNRFQERLSRATSGTIKFSRAVIPHLSTFEGDFQVEKMLRGFVPTGTISQSLARSDRGRRNFRPMSMIETIEVWPEVEPIREENKTLMRFTINDRNGVPMDMRLTQVSISNKNNALYIGWLTKPGQSATPFAFRSASKELELFSLLESYINNVTVLTLEAPEDLDEESAIGPVQRETNEIPRNKSDVPEYDHVNLTQKARIAKLKFVALVQSLLGRSVTTGRNDTPEKTEILRNQIQLINSVTRGRGTTFPDEAEPVVFSMLFQAGIIDDDTILTSMSYKVGEGGRIPYVIPTSDDERKTRMFVRRPQSPRLPGAPNESVSEELRLVDRIVDNIQDQTGLSLEVGRRVNDIIRNIEADPETEIQNKVNIMLATQTIILDLLKASLLIDYTAVAGRNLLSNVVTGRVSAGDATLREEVEQEEQRILNEYERIWNDLGKKVSSKLSNNSDDPRWDIIQRNNSLLRQAVTQVKEKVVSSGDSFFSANNLERIYKFSGLDPQDEYRTIRATVDRLLNLFNTLSFLSVYGGDKSVSAKAFEENALVVNLIQVENAGNTSRAQQVEMGGSIVVRLLATIDVIRQMSGVLEAIRHVSGGDLELDPQRQLEVSGETEKLSIREEYGISEPIPVAGNKKPEFQVVSGHTTSVMLSITTEIEDLFLLGELRSDLTSVLDKETGADALYNIVREPGNVRTVSNMLRAGRSIKKSTTAGSGTTRFAAASREDVVRQFRLAKDIAAVAKEANAIRSLLSTPVPDVEVEERLLRALSLRDMVAKSVSIQSGVNTLSWNINCLLVNFEPAYSAKNNLTRLNRSLSNAEMGDVASWLGASFPNNFEERFEELNDQVEDDEFEAVNRFAGNPGNLRASFMKSAGARLAIGHNFAAMVALYAIAKGRKKVDRNIDLAISLAGFEGSRGINEDNDTPEAAYGRSTKLVNKALDYAADDAITLNPFSKWNTQVSVPTGSWEYSASVDVVGYSGAVLGLGVGIWLGRKADKSAPSLLSRLAGKRKGTVAKLLRGASAVKGLGSVATMGTINLVANLARSAYVTIASDPTVANIERFMASKDTDIPVVVSLSQDFAQHAMDFLIEFSLAEAEGSGIEFIESIAQEASNVTAISTPPTPFRQEDPNVLIPQEGDGKYGWFRSRYPLLVPFKAEPGGRDKSGVSLIVFNTLPPGTREILLEKIQDTILSRWEEMEDRIDISEVDKCGRELVSLIAEGQASMITHSIQAIHEYPRVVLGNPEFFYNGVRPVFGRLRADRFALDLVGRGKGLISSARAATLFSEESPFVNPNPPARSRGDSLPKKMGLRFDGTRLIYENIERRKLPVVANTILQHENAFGEAKTNATFVGDLATLFPMQPVSLLSQKILELSTVRGEPAELEERVQEDQGDAEYSLFEICEDIYKNILSEQTKEEVGTVPDLEEAVRLFNQNPIGNTFSGPEIGSTEEALREEKERVDAEIDRLVRRRSGLTEEQEAASNELFREITKLRSLSEALRIQIESIEGSASLEELQQELQRQSEKLAELESLIEDTINIDQQIEDLQARIEKINEREIEILSEEILDAGIAVIDAELGEGELTLEEAEQNVRDLNNELKSLAAERREKESLLENEPFEDPQDYIDGVQLDIDETIQRIELLQAQIGEKDVSLRIVGRDEADFDKFFFILAAWAYNALFREMNGLSARDFVEADPTTAINRSVNRSLAEILAKEEGISVEDALNIVRERSNDVGFYQRGDGQRILEEACTSIALYNEGDGEGKRVVFTEFSKFFRSCKQVMSMNVAEIELLRLGSIDPRGPDVPASTFGTDIGSGFAQESLYAAMGDNKAATAQRNYRSAGVDVSGTTFGALSDTPWSVVFTGARNNTALQDTPILPSFSLLPNRKTEVATTILNDEETVSDVFAFIKHWVSVAALTGTANPEYIPKILGVPVEFNGGVTGFAMTPFTFGNISFFTSGENPQTVESKWKVFWRVGANSIIGGTDTFSTIVYGVSVVLTALSVAKTVGLLVATIAGTTVGVIIAIVVVIVFIVGAILLRDVARSLFLDLESIDKASKINVGNDIGGIRVGPLFTSMKALVSATDSINSFDLRALAYPEERRIGAQGQVVGEFVPGPNLRRGLDDSGFVLNDTLAYLQLPIIIKKGATDIVDIIPPGGHVYPRTEKLNKDAMRLSNALLLADLAAESSLDQIPREIENLQRLQYGEIQNNNTTGLIPPIGDSTERIARVNSIDFLKRIQSIHVGFPSGSLSANGISLPEYVKDTGGFTGFFNPSGDGLDVGEMLNAIPTMFAWTFGTARRGGVTELRSYHEAVTTFMQTLAGIGNPPEVTFRTVGGNDSERFLLAGLTELHRIERNSEIEVTDISEFDIVLPLENKERSEGDGLTNLFTRMDLHVRNVFKLRTLVNEATKDSIVSEANRSLEKGGASARIFVSRGDGYLFENSVLLGFGEGGIDRAVTFLDRQEILNSNTLQNSNMYVFRDSITSGEVEALEKISNALNNLIAQIENVDTPSYDGEEKDYSYMDPNISPSGMALRPKSMGSRDFEDYMLPVHLLRVAFDNRRDSAIITPTPADLVIALKEIWGWLADSSYLTRQLESVNSNFSVSLSDTAQVRLIPDVDSVEDVSEEQVALRTASMISYVSKTISEKIEAYMGDEASVLWTAYDKNREILRDLIMQPLRAYPTAKVFFIEKDRGNFVLYDDLFSYSDIVSIELVDSCDDPGSTAMITLTNSEYKLDNILSARLNSENPFEARGEVDDKLAGMLLKAGTPLAVYMGYGGILTEEDKWIMEIESVEKTQDNRVILLCRGPGWILHTAMNKATGTVLQIEREDLGQLRDASGEAVDIDELRLSERAVAKHLLLFGLIRIARVQNFARLGSDITTGFELISTNIDEIVPEGGTVITSAINAVKDAIAQWTYRNMLGDDILDQIDVSPEASQALSEINDTTSTFGRNIMLSTMTSSPMSIWGKIATGIASFISNESNASWKVKDETVWEFCKSVMMNVHNGRVLVRNYGTEGSLIIGTREEYYSLFPPKGFSSLLSFSLSRELAIELEEKDPKNLLKRFFRVMQGAFTDQTSKRRDKMKLLVDMAVTITGTIAIAQPNANINTLLLNGVDDGSMPDLTASNIKGLRVLHNILYGDETRHLRWWSNFVSLLREDPTDRIRHPAYVINTLASIFNINIKLTPTTSGVIASIQRELTTLDTGGIVGNQITLLNINSIIEEGVKGIAFPESLEGQEMAEEENQRIMLDMGITGEGVQAGRVSEEDRSRIISENPSVPNLMVASLCVSIGQTFANRYHRMQSLAPEKRPIRKVHQKLDRKDIVHNSITTMLGFNELTLVFEPVDMQSVQFGKAGNVADALRRIIGNDKVDRLNFSVSPLATVDADYSSKVLVSGIVNPTSFANFTGINIPRGIFVQAIEGMSQMVRDWYDGFLHVLGDADVRPNDGVDIYDEITDMVGQIDVKQVIHRYNIRGYISSVRPSVVTYTIPDESSDNLRLFNIIYTALAVGGSLIASAYVKNKILQPLVSRTGLSDKILKYTGEVDSFAKKAIDTGTGRFGRVAGVARRKGLRKTLTKIVGISNIRRSADDFSTKALLKAMTKGFGVLLLALPAYTLWKLPRRLLRSIASSRGFEAVKRQVKEDTDDILNAIVDNVTSRAYAEVSGPAYVTESDNIARRLFEGLDSFTSGQKATDFASGGLSAAVRRASNRNGRNEVLEVLESVRTRADESVNKIAERARAIGRRVEAGELTAKEGADLLNIRIERVRNGITSGTGEQLVVAIRAEREKIRALRLTAEEAQQNADEAVEVATGDAATEADDGIRLFVRESLVETNQETRDNLVNVLRAQAQQTGESTIIDVLSELPSENISSTQLSDAFETIAETAEGREQLGAIFNRIEQISNDANDIERVLFGTYVAHRRIQETINIRALKEEIVDQNSVVGVRDGIQETFGENAEFLEFYNRYISDNYGELLQDSNLVEQFRQIHQLRTSSGSIDDLFEIGTGTVIDGIQVKTLTQLSSANAAILGDVTVSTNAIATAISSGEGNARAIVSNLARGYSADGSVNLLQFSKMESDELADYSRELLDRAYADAVTRILTDSDASSDLLDLVEEVNSRLSRRGLDIFKEGIEVSRFAKNSVYDEVLQEVLDTPGGRSLAERIEERTRTVLGEYISQLNEGSRGNSIIKEIEKRASGIVVNRPANDLREKAVKDAKSAFEKIRKKAADLLNRTDDPDDVLTEPVTNAGEKIDEATDAFRLDTAIQAERNRIANNLRRKTLEVLEGYASGAENVASARSATANSILRGRIDTYIGELASAGVWSRMRATEGLNLPNKLSNDPASRRRILGRLLDIDSELIRETVEGAASIGGRLLGTTLGIFGTYTTLQEVVGGPMDEYIAKLGDRSTFKSFRSHFLIYKGEVFTSNIEILKKGDAQALSPTFSNVMASRFFDFSGIHNSVVGIYDGILSSLAQNYQEQGIHQQVNLKSRTVNYGGLISAEFIEAVAEARAIAGAIGSIKDRVQSPLGIDGDLIEKGGNKRLKAVSLFGMRNFPASQGKPSLQIHKGVDLTIHKSDLSENTVHPLIEGVVTSRTTSAAAWWTEEDIEAANRSRRGRSSTSFGVNEAIANAAEEGREISRRGNNIFIRHTGGIGPAAGFGSSGLITRYAHLGGEREVNAGNEVSGDDLLGNISTSGNSQVGKHLHLELVETQSVSIERDGETINKTVSVYHNPLRYLEMAGYRSVPFGPTLRAVRGNRLKNGYIEANFLVRGIPEGSTKTKFGIVKPGPVASLTPAQRLRTSEQYASVTQALKALGVTPREVVERAEEENG